MNPNDWHTLTLEALEHELGSDLDDGLAEREGEHRLGLVT